MYKYRTWSNQWGRSNQWNSCRVLPHLVLQYRLVRFPALARHGRLLALGVPMFSIATSDGMLCCCVLSWLSWLALCLCVFCCFGWWLLQRWPWCDGCIYFCCVVFLMYIAFPAFWFARVSYVCLVAVCGLPFFFVCLYVSLTLCLELDSTQLYPWIYSIVCCYALLDWIAADLIVKHIIALLCLIQE